MATTGERAIQRTLKQLASQLAAAVPDIGACQKTLSELGALVDTFLIASPPAIVLSPKLWSDALLEQARQDLQAAEIMAARAGPATVLAMLLQMFFEKLAKAVLARTDLPSFAAHRNSHATASRLINLLKVNNRYNELRYKWSDVLPLIQELERVHPAIAKGGPHLEYPWEGEDRMALPSEVRIVRTLADPLDMKGPKLLRFARELSNRFEEIFG
jgi:hypothetical protein